MTHTSNGTKKICLHAIAFFRLLYRKGNKTLTQHALFLRRRYWLFAWTDTGEDCDVKKVVFIAHLWHLSFLYLYRCQAEGLLIAGEKIIYLDNHIPSPHAIDMGGIVSLWYQNLLRCFAIKKKEVGFIYPSSSAFDCQMPMYINYAYNLCSNGINDV